MEMLASHMFRFPVQKTPLYPDMLLYSLLLKPGGPAAVIVPDGILSPRAAPARNVRPDYA